MRRRFIQLRAHWLVLVLVIITPFITGAITMSTVSEPSKNSTGQPELRAAIVNNDQLVYEKIDHKKTPVAAGRLLVGELVTNPDDGFNWTITNDATAKAGLDSGEFVAMVTIPEDFSASYISSSSDAPVQATLEVQTDGSHSYMAAILALALTQDLTSSLSSQLTQTFVDNLLVGYSELSTGLGELAYGSEELTLGLGELAKLTKSLPSLTKELNSGAHALNTGMNTFAKDLLALAVVSKAAAEHSKTAAEQVEVLSATVDAMAPSPEKVALQTQLAALTISADTAAIKAAETEIGVILAEAYAKEMQKGTAALAAGTKELASGMPVLHKSIAESERASHEITKALHKLVKGLPNYSDSQATTLSEVVANPIVTKQVTKPKLPSALGAVGAVMIPITLWIGALAISFIRPPFAERSLRSRASTSKIVADAAVPFVAIAIAQAALVLGGLYVFHLQPVYHLELTAVVTLSAIAFALVHQGLLALTGRFAWLISLALMSVQILAAAVVLPAVFVPSWVVTLGHSLPLSESIKAMQEIITGGQRAHVTGALIWLALWAVIGLCMSLAAVARGRRMRAVYA